MKQLHFVLFLWIENMFFFCFSVSGQIIKTLVNQNQSDCYKLNSLLNDLINTNANSCCSEDGITCDNEGYIISLRIEGYKDTDFSLLPKFSRLETFLLEEHPMKEIPSNIFELPSLKKLILRSNQIEIIPPSIKNLAGLEVLDLYNNTIIDLPNELFDLKKLKTLNLENNKIKIIPPSIKNLEELSYLGLHANEIKKLPDEIFKLSKLDTLSLGENKIETVPSSISELKELKILDLEYNELTELPNEIFKLKNLDGFGIDFNPKLNTKIIKFGNSTVDDCYFSDVNISCYQSHACQTIHINEKNYTDIESKTLYNTCTQEEIDEILNPHPFLEGLESIAIFGVVIIFALFVIIIVGAILIILIDIIINLIDIIITKKKAKSKNELDISIHENNKDREMESHHEISETESDFTSPNNTLDKSNDNLITTGVAIPVNPISKNISENHENISEDVSSFGDEYQSSIDIQNQNQNSMINLNPNVFNTVPTSQNNYRGSFMPQNNYQDLLVIPQNNYLNSYIPQNSFNNGFFSSQYGSYPMNMNMGNNMNIGNNMNMVNSMNMNNPISPVLNNNQYNYQGLLVIQNSNETINDGHSNKVNLNNGNTNNKSLGHSEKEREAELDKANKNITYEDDPPEYSEK